ncbi:MAG: nitroreductase family protein, partial [Rhodobiaceae bacterium]
MSNQPRDVDRSLSRTEEADALRILGKMAGRASCREFDGSDIALHILEEIVRDGVEAPSSCNQQNWHFIIVTDQDRKQRARNISGGNH